MTERAVEYYGREEGRYPGRLKALSRMPAGLYVKGALRMRTSLGCHCGSADVFCLWKAAGVRLCKNFSRAWNSDYQRTCIWIDASAHEGALAGGEKTFAVLGCGVDICYPKENYPLYRQILSEGGGVLSEFPMGSAPEAWHFPVRNRIISGLSDAVLIVEAKERSGSLITADYALEQGKSVFALPGRVGDSLSKGCNYLLYQGAGVAYSPECIMEELGVRYQKNLERKKEIVRMG